MAEFFIVDVFTDKKFSGNPLAVVLDPGEYKANQMQAIAREFNFSETTFAQIQSKGGTFPVRIFTPIRDPVRGSPNTWYGVGLARTDGTWRTGHPSSGSGTGLCRLRTRQWMRNRMDAAPTA
jgi:hypothetical protein